MSPEQPSFDLSPEFRKFYDPNGYTAVFGEIRDPMLLYWLDYNRRNDILLPTERGVMPFSGRRTLAVEQAHLLNITKNDFTKARGLGLSNSELSESVDVAVFGATQVVNCLVRATDAMLDNNPEINRQVEAKDPMKILVRSMMLSAVTHRGQKRLSGNDYYGHPRDGAIMLGMAARMSRRVIGPEQSVYLRRLQSLELFHDGIEKHLKKNGGSFLSSEGIVLTPLTHYILLEACGLSPAEAMDDATSLLGLTNTVGPDGKGAYDPYIHEIVGYPREKTVKKADVDNNLNIDPKRTKPLSELLSQEELERVLHVHFTEKKYAAVLPMLTIGDDELVDPFLRDINQNIDKIKPSDLDKFRKTGSSRILNMATSEMMLTEWDRAWKLAA